jgi:Fe-S-cluster containining protein
MKEVSGNNNCHDKIVDSAGNDNSSSSIHSEWEHISIQQNNNIAYNGDIGRLRKEFCESFIANKQKVFEKINQEQKRKTIYEDITCHKGCANCCVLSVGASIQEGESIVYYLYQNKDLLNYFLMAYPNWRAKVKSHEHLFHKEPPCDAKTNANIACGFQYKIIDDLAEYAYSRLNITCPFLRDGVCSIYEVRPLVCAGLIATTPSERCNPQSKERARQYQITNDYFIDDTDTYKFYVKDLKKPIWSIMPIMVYNILVYGLEWVLAVTGIDNNEKS